MAKQNRKLTVAQRRKQKRLAEKLKGRKGIRNPFAVATAQVKKSAAKRRRKRKR